MLKTMKILRLSDTNLEQAAQEAALVLQKGGLVLFPTDTLYGLAVNALDTEALARLRDVKGRERRKPISIIVPDIASIDVHASLHPKARVLADKHLPGALTLVLPAASHIPDEVALNGSIGVRVPDDAFALAFARAAGVPITATSANKSGYQPPATVDGVISQLRHSSLHIDLVIDAGERSGGVPSTVVTFIDEIPYVLREGALSRATLGI